MSILNEIKLGRAMFSGRGHGSILTEPTPSGTTGWMPSVIIQGWAVGASAAGKVLVRLDEDSTDPVTLPTTVDCLPGDKLIIEVIGTDARVIGVVGGGDRTALELDKAMQEAVAAAEEAAEARDEASAAQTAANTAAEVAAEAEAKAAEAEQTAALAEARAEEAKTDATVAKEAADNAAAEALIVSASLEDYRERTDAAIEQTADQILLTVASEYATQDELGSLEATMSSELAVRDTDITLRFEQAAQATGEVAEDFAADKAERDAYYRFSGDAMEIGRTESVFRTIIDNTHLGFLQDGVEIAAVYNNRMYNTRLEVSDTITQGVDGVGFFDLVLKANGNLALKARSG